MKKQIVDILKKYNLTDKFYIGSGAQGKSLVRLVVDKYDPQLLTADYALQYDSKSETLVVWDIRKRIEMSASLDLYIKSSFEWDQIQQLQIYTVSIKNRNSGQLAHIAAMPFEQFEDFLVINKYLGFSIPVSSVAFDEDDLRSFEIVDNGASGKIVYFYGSEYEKEGTLKEAAVSEQGYSCSICGFNYENTYGSIGTGFIEVHHIKPLFQKEKVNPEKDLIVVCANCHKVLHRKKSAQLRPDELREML